MLVRYIKDATGRVKEYALSDFAVAESEAEGKTVLSLDVPDHLVAGIDTDAHALWQYLMDNG